MNTQKIYDDLSQSEGLAILENNTYKEINTNKISLLNSINDFFNKAKLSNEDIMDIYELTPDLLNKIRFNKDYLLDLNFLSNLEDKLLNTLEVPEWV